MSDLEVIVKSLLAVSNGDCYLDADGCATLLGYTKAGKPDAAAFLRHAANQPGFPAPFPLNGKRNAWKRSKVIAWADRRCA